MMNSNHNRSVVVTGASTGIGRACALHMDRLGWQVFAGVRSQRDAASLRRESSEHLVPLLLDVTDPASVRKAMTAVAKILGGLGLSGLVNNAGIPYGGPVEFLDLNEVRRLYEVNLFGAIAVTQAYLPLLRQARGRIVNMSSVGGMVSAPFVSPYASSKFALEALSDALRMELHPWGMHVSVIEPGAIDTPIWDKAGDVIQSLVRGAPEEGRRLYGTAIEGMSGRFLRHGISSDAVTRAVAHALASPHPKARYRIGFEGALIHLVQLLPDRLRDWLILSQLPKWG